MHFNQLVPVNAAIIHQDFPYTLLSVTECSCNRRNSDPTGSLEFVRYLAHVDMQHLGSSK